MTPEQARETFGDAHDGFLDDEARAEFDAALDADESLRAEFTRYQALCRAAGSLGDDAAPTPDLLRGVQHKLRQRSGGRYFRDRFSQRAKLGMPWPVVMAVAMLALMLLAWVLLERTTLVSSDTPRPAPSAPSTR